MAVVDELAVGVLHDYKIFMVMCFLYFIRDVLSLPTISMQHFFCYLTRAAAVEKFRTDVHSQIIILMTNLSPFLSMCVCVYAKKIIQIYYFNLECKDYK